MTTSRLRQCDRNPNLFGYYMIAPSAGYNKPAALYPYLARRFLYKTSKQILRAIAPPLAASSIVLPRKMFRCAASKFLFPEGSGAGISTPSASADPLLAGAGTAASAVVGCSRERARAASSALADIAAGSRCYPRDVFAAARPLLLARKEERCVGARSRSTSVHSNNSLCSEIGRLANPPS